MSTTKTFLDTALLTLIFLVSNMTSAKAKPTRQIVTMPSRILAELTSSPASSNDLIRDADKRRQCSERSPDDLKRQLTSHFNQQPIHPSYYMLPQLQTAIGEKSISSGSAEEFPVSGRQECPRSLYDISGEKNVQDRSLCPWYNVLSHNPDRYPVDIVEARCRCTSCVGVGAETGAGCEPVYYNVPVLWRTNTCLEDGSYKYEKGWQKIAVGCTCAMASSR